VSFGTSPADDPKPSWLVPPSPAGGRRSQGIACPLRSDFADALGSGLLLVLDLNPQPPSVEHLGGVLTPGEINPPPPRNMGNPLRSITANAQPDAAVAAQAGAAVGRAESFRHRNEEN
jgi:hypothetical protein